MSTKPSTAMTSEEIDRFLGTQDIGVICAVDAAGNLVARVVEICNSSTSSEVTLASSAAADLSIGPACFVVDDCPSYHDIKGVLLRGALTIEGTHLRLTCSHASGFDFSKAPRPEGG